MKFVRRLLRISACLMLLGSNAQADDGGTSDGGGSTLPTEIDCEFPFENKVVVMSVVRPDYVFSGWKNGTIGVITNPNVGWDEIDHVSVARRVVKTPSGFMTNYTHGKKHKFSVMVSNEWMALSKQEREKLKYIRKDLTYTVYRKASINYEKKKLSLSGVCIYHQHEYDPKN